MRLTCPDCGAQYEVEDEQIPPGGRDVQCSNCDHAWFETRDDAAATPPPLPELAPEDLRSAARDRLARSTERTRIAPAPADMPADAADSVASFGTAAPPPRPWADDDGDETDGPAVNLRRALDRMRPPAPGTEPDDDDPDDAENGPPPGAPQIRPRPSDEVLDILRSEARRERDARRAEAQAQTLFADQPELDMDTPPRRARDTPAPAENAPPEPPQAGQDSGPAAHRRRDLLPDIEEVTSTLDAPGDTGPSGVPAPARRRQRTGAWIGFLGVLGAMGLAALVYGQAGHLAEAVPAAASHIDAYVDWVNTNRLWLDRAARGLVGGLVGAPEA